MVSAGTRGAADQPSLTASRAPLVFPPGTQAASPRGPLRWGSKGTRSCRAPGGSVPGPERLREEAATKQVSAASSLRGDPHLCAGAGRGDPHPRA